MTSDVSGSMRSQLPGCSREERNLEAAVGFDGELARVEIAGLAAAPCEP